DLRFPQVELSPECREQLKLFSSGLAEYMKTHPVYGVNTGCGSRKSMMIPQEEIVNYQKHYIPAHCVGYGDPFAPEITRMAMILRANSFARGNSGIRLELCEKILEVYNAGIVPCIPQKGSVGSSGDLCPLAHMSAVIIGLPEQEAWYNGETLSAPEALQKAGVEPIELGAKEAMGLTNGSTFQLAMLVLAIYDSRRLYKYANIAAALSLEAIRGEQAAFDKRIHEARGQEGQIIVAEEMLRMLHGSKRSTHEAREVCLDAEEKTKKSHTTEDGEKKWVPRVQDAYSFRAHPQVLGTVLANMDYVQKIIEAEINASTDNPLVFKREDGGYETRSGGNFHGEPLAQAADFLKIAIAQVANISDRRFFAMLIPEASYGLPADLAGKSELNTGLMILQYTTAALVSENKILCHPAVVDSIPTSGNQEDYVSMGTIAARHLRIVVDNSYAVIAAEILAACQGISLTEEQLKKYGVSDLGAVTSRAYDMVRKVLPVMDDDRYLSKDLYTIIELLKSGELLEL
ncbi:MAG: aromatic amino acid lyase, partial [Patescibacteria group bacterium]|nr:aromatic amino acid lyase [Patescibacteria group bacterium]